MFLGEIKAVNDLESGNVIAYIRKVTSVTSLKENGKWQGLVKRPPGFSLSNQDGAQVSLSDQAGKYVLIWWYPKADTPG